MMVPLIPAPVRTCFTAPIFDARTEQLALEVCENPWFVCGNFKMDDAIVAH